MGMLTIELSDAAEASLRQRAEDCGVSVEVLAREELEAATAGYDAWVEQELRKGLKDLDEGRVIEIPDGDLDTYFQGIRDRVLRRRA